MLSHLPCEALHLPDFRLVLVFGWVNLDNHWGCRSTASARFAFDVEGCLIDRLGKLYSHCLTTAGNMPTAIELETPQIKDVATTFFIQASTFRSLNLAASQPHLLGLEHSNPI